MRPGFQESAARRIWRTLLYKIRKKGNLTFVFGQHPEVLDDFIRIVHPEAFIGDVDTESKTEIGRVEPIILNRVSYMKINTLFRRDGRHRRGFAYFRYFRRPDRF